MLNSKLLHLSPVVSELLCIWLVMVFNVLGLQAIRASWTTTMSTGVACHAVRLPPMKCLLVRVIHLPVALLSIQSGLLGNSFQLLWLSLWAFSPSGSDSQSSHYSVDSLLNSLPLKGGLLSLIISSGVSSAANSSWRWSLKLAQLVVWKTKVNLLK